MFNTIKSIAGYGDGGRGGAGDGNGTFSRVDLSVIFSMLTVFTVHSGLTFLDLTSQ